MSKIIGNTTTAPSTIIDGQIKGEVRAEAFRIGNYSLTYSVVTQNSITLIDEYQLAVQTTALTDTTNKANYTIRIENNVDVYGCYTLLVFRDGVQLYNADILTLVDVKKKLKFFGLELNGTVTTSNEFSYEFSGNAGIEYGANGIDYSVLGGNWYPEYPTSIKLNSSEVSATNSQNPYYSNYSLSDKRVQGESASTSGDTADFYLGNDGLSFHTYSGGETTEFSMRNNTVSGSDELKSSWKKWLELESSVAIDPVFANNSWEVIKWVSQYDDPSKYWKVGDYKFIDYPEVTRPGYISDSTSGKSLFFQTRNNTRPSVNSLGTVMLKYPHKLANLIENAAITSGSKDEGTFRIYTYFWKEDIVKPCLCFFATGDTYPTDIIHEALTFKQLLEDIGAVITKTADGETYLTEENLTNYGVHISQGFSYVNGETYPAKQYPIMILGFNHDNISNPYEYGKSKAGMTLCLGITRAVTENSPPYNWDTAVLPNLYESGTSQFDAANGDNTLMSPYWLGDGTNWQDTQFRTELQNLLNGTELEDKIVSVEKITAAGMWQEGNNYFPKVFTDDKISLLSEYEIIGTPKFSNAQEGDQYEFFKRGNSRFYWNTALVNNEVQRLYLWLRSPINPKSFSSGVDKPLDYKGGCNLQCNSTEKAITSDSSIATIIDNTTAMNAIENLIGNLSDYRYAGIPVVYSITDGAYYIEIQGSVASPEGSNIFETFNTVEDAASFLSGYGVALVDSSKDASFEIRISRNEQVGYSQGANSGNTKGSLLPIFCM